MTYSNYAFYLDEDGTYIVEVLGVKIPLLLDLHETSFYINTEDPAFDELEMMQAEDAHLYG